MKIFIFILLVLTVNFVKAQVIEETIVNARKQQENLQSVPIAVTAITGKQLANKVILHTTDLDKVVPNLTFSNNAPLSGNNNSAIVFIRGIGQISAAANVDPGVGVYVDDVYIGQSVGSQYLLNDVATVEVLRGPQGSLFGRNTIGGAVLINTVKPSDQQSGEHRLRFGNDNLIEYFQANNVPLLNDNLLTRINFAVTQRDGYVTRVSDGIDLGDTNELQLTMRADYLQAPTLTHQFKVSLRQNNSNGSPLVFAGINPNTNVTNIEWHPGWIAANQSVAYGCPQAWVALPGSAQIEVAANATVAIPENVTGPLGYVNGSIDDSRCANDLQGAGAFANKGTLPLQSHVDNVDFSYKLEHNYSAYWKSKLIYSYRTLNWGGIRDADNTPLTILHTDFQSQGFQQTAELQLQYTAKNSNLLFGIYHYLDYADDALLVTVGSGSSSCADGLLRCEQLVNNNLIQNNANALFFHGDFELSSKLKLSVGLRQTSENKKSTPDQYPLATPDVPYLENKTYSADFADTNVSVNLSYQLANNAFSYWSYSEGFKGGGWNTNFSFPLNDSDLEAGHKFNQEQVVNYEWGIKTNIGEAMQLNAAIFAAQYSDIQFTYRVAIAPWIFNAGSASINGAELEWQWLPTYRWRIDASFGYLQSSIDEPLIIIIPNRTVSTNVKQGNQLPFTPEFKFNFGLAYDTVINDYPLSAAVSLTHIDPMFFDAANSAIIAQLDPVQLVDANINYQVKRWQYQLGINNLTDATYRISGNSSYTTGTAYAEVAYARPRSVFIAASYQY